VSLEKEQLIPLQEELLRQLGYDETCDFPDFIFHYQEIVDAMLEHCSMRFAYEVCRISKLQYERDRKSLLKSSKYSELQELVEGVDDIELDESDLSLPAESEILEVLLYCYEDPDVEAFELLLKRLDKLSVDMSVFGKLMSEVKQVPEGSPFWFRMRAELLFRRVNEKDRSTGDIRIARGVFGPRYERDYVYLGTQQESDEFETYRRKLADSWAFTLAEWVKTYDQLINYKS